MSSKKLKVYVLVMFILFSFILSIQTCSNFLASKGATIDGDTLISYAADSHSLYGALYHWPAADHKEGEKITIIDWDSQEYLGEIDQVAHTHTVVGNTNEYSVTVTETTFGGLAALSHQDVAVLDYGNLMWIALQRSKTAREAIHVIDGLMQSNGYASGGESFSIGDPDEVWIMEIIGKGNFEKGAVWVARRVPDGYVCAHANQARIQKFPQDDSNDTLYAKDVISFAKDHGFYPKESPDVDFSFSDVYDPVSFSSARFCEARVYSMFSRVTDVTQYLEYAKGFDLKNRMPLWVQPDKKVDLKGVIDLFRNHFEDTWFDMTTEVDFGNQPFVNPYRWRPMTWKSGDKEYLNERAVSTQQTSFSMVSQMRGWLPKPIGGILWFGVDDTYTTVYTPMYCSITEIARSWRNDSSVGTIMDFSMDSAFWVFNLVANWAYTKYDFMIKDIQEKQKELEDAFMEEVPSVDAVAKDLYDKDPQAAIQLLTQFSKGMGEHSHAEWRDLFYFLVPKYIDGDVKMKVPGKPLPHIDYPGYNPIWYQEIVNTTGTHFITADGLDDPRVTSKLGRTKGV